MSIKNLRATIVIALLMVVTYTLGGSVAFGVTAAILALLQLVP